MISVEEAYRIVLANCIHAEIELVRLEEAQGRILAEDIFADRDFPPFDRVTMDGIAINFDSFESGNRSFRIAGIAAAGNEQVALHKENECVEAMTGAMLPDNTDTIIRYEDLEIVKKVARITIEGIQRKQNIHFLGLDRKKGSLILEKGKNIQAPELGVLATSGKARVNVYKTPKIAVISSGDELVNVDQEPEPYQIRKSNTYSIAGLLNQFQVELDHFHLLDDPEDIVEELAEILNHHDVIILSGGVSKGKFDYIPDSLAQLGVKKLFHKVKQRPGKPFWFGKSEEGKIVFALPGNPVSSFMCTNKYVIPWMRKHLSVGDVGMHAELASPITFKPDLTYYAQVKLEYNAQGKILAHPIEGNGSGDLANLTDADAFMELPRGKDFFDSGEAYPFIMYR